MLRAVCAIDSACARDLVAALSRSRLETEFAAWVEKLVAHSGWRLMMLIGAVPALLTFFIQLLVPESKRWQHEKSQGSTSHWASRDLLAVVVGTAGPLVMILLWVPDSAYSLGVRIGGSIVGVGLAVVGFIFPVFRYLSGRAPLETDRLWRSGRRCAACCWERA